MIFFAEIKKKFHIFASLKYQDTLLKGKTEIMNEISTGFLTGLGGTLGVVFAVGVLLGAWTIIKIFIKRHRAMRKMPKLMLQYRTVLISLEKFDEIIEIDRFLEKLKRNEMPKELSLRYSAKYLKEFLKQHAEA